MNLSLECRYDSKVSTESPLFAIRRPPAHTLDLVFEVDIRTAYKTNSALLDVDSDLFRQIAGQIVYQVENNWVGKKPWKVGINHFMFFYDDLATAVKDKDFDDLKDREEFFENEDTERNK